MTKRAVFSLAAAASIFGAWQAAAQEYRLEAESGVISAPFVVANRCLCQPNNSTVTNGGRAAFTFTVPTAGEYAISALVNAPPGSSNAFYVNIDAEPKDPSMVWAIPASSGFTNRIVTWAATAGSGVSAGSARSFTLTPGTHQLIVRGTTANTQLRSVSIFERPAPPTGLHVVGPR
jgi:hypothetical protein